jgi:hypothetical protein
MCYSEAVVRDGFVTRTWQSRARGYGVCLTWIWGLSYVLHVLSFQKSWQLWKEARATISPLVWAPNGAECFQELLTSCENDCMIRLVIANALKLWLKKLLLIPPPNTPNVFQTMVQLDQTKTRPKRLKQGCSGRGKGNGCYWTRSSKVVTDTRSSLTLGRRMRC